MDELIAAMFVKNGTTHTSNWRDLKPSKKRGLLLQESDKLFRDALGVRQYLQRLCRDAADLQKHRNVLLHGRVWTKYSVTAAGDGQSAFYADVTAIECQGRQNGQEVTFTYDLEGVKGLFYDMAHLNGRLFDANMPAEHHASDLSSRDRRLIRERLSTGHPASSVPEALQSPP